MKNNPLLWVITALLAASTVYLFLEINHLREENKSCSEKCNSAQTDSFLTTADTIAKPIDEDEIELVHYMTRIQVFHNKLYFAGMENNIKLVEFYLHEIEEEMETIAEAGIIDDEVHISDNMKNLGLEQIHSFQKTLGTPEYNFKKSYDLLTVTCNTCHTASKHEFIKIKTPTSLPFSNQEFKP